MTWRLARSLDELRTQINAAYPNRSKVSDGTIGNAAHAARTSDHNPDSLGIVRAADFTHDPTHGFDSYAFAHRILELQDRRLKYVISNGYIGGGPGHYAAPSGYCPKGIKPGVWLPYAGPNRHDHHVHISVVPTSIADNTAQWSGVRNEDDMPITDADAEKIVHQLLVTNLGSSGPTVAVALQRAGTLSIVDALKAVDFAGIVRENSNGGTVDADAIAEKIATDLAERLKA